ncbi:right-handed parallel beta-helix repeat-containing protein [Halosimplex halobium]|uniref:right-handed parallel beta-helix repeat-containing protein n=1 Tax=Halosimplex halobium TaxID=3396618 RepID=UPI003F56B9AB
MRLQGKATRRLYLLGLLCMLSGSVELQGDEIMTDYYIDANGDDSNPGTESEPFATFAPLEYTGRTPLGAGDRVFVSGVIEENGTVTFWAQHGSESAPITIRSHPDQHGVVDFSNLSDGHGFKIGSSSWFELLDLEVRHAPDHNVHLQGGTSDVLVEGLDSHGMSRVDDYGSALNLSDAHNVTIRDCYLHDSGPDGAGNSDGVHVVGGSSDVLVEDCVFDRCSDDGIDLWGAANGTATVRRCIATHSGYDADGNAVGDGNGFKMGGGDGTGGHRFERCVAYDNAQRGFNDNLTTEPQTVYNCTAWNNGSEGYRLTSATHEVRNCISWENNGGTGMFDSADDQYNSWNLTIDDPQFRSIDPASEDFLHLSSDSPARDAGTDVGLLYTGSAPDLGAYEYSAPLRVYTGSNWEQAAAKYYDGSQFVLL